MDYELSGSEPIFLQIAEIIKADIISGKLLQGEKLKSVREFSSDFKANPNTVQKSLFELEKIGLIYTDRTNGKFVTNNKEIIDCVREQIFQEKSATFLAEMKQMGFSKNDIIDLIKKGENNG